MSDPMPRVFFSDRAFNAILAETREYPRTETGGIFLGCYENGNYYILETLDPGPNSIFRPAYFEYDDGYVTHLANKTKRFYKHGLKLIGLWHRHPGGYDRFSGVDDGTNTKYAIQERDGIISALVNIDPGFRLTVYQVRYPLSYERVGYQVGDHLIPGHIRELKTRDEYLSTWPRASAAFCDRLEMALLPLDEKLQADEDKEPVDLPVRISAPSRNGQHNLMKRFLTFIWKRKPVQKVDGELPEGQKNRPEEGLGDLDSPPLSPTTSWPMQQSAAADAAKLAILDMIDNEIIYLQAQRDYHPTIRVEGSRAVVILDLLHQMAGYPDHITFVFGLAEKIGFVQVEDRRYRYSADFIHRFINQSICLAMEGRVTR